MEKEILFISLLTLVYLYDFTILNQDLSYPCTIRNKLGKVKLSFIRHSKDISGLIPFSLYLKNNISGKIDNASCYIYIKDFKIFNFNLFQQRAYAYCYFLSDILDDINNYKISSVKSKYDIKVDDNFKFNASNKDEYSSHNMSIFYRKVDNFEFVSKKGTFMFYGQKKLLSKSLDSITFIIKLYYENYNEIREAKCSRKKIEDISSYIQQISYKCEIAEMNNNFKNLRILDSDYVSGIPYDYNNMDKDPIETQKATKARSLVSKKNYEFVIYNIYSNNKGDILIFNGTLSDEIIESKIFSIPLLSSDKCQSECYVPASASSKEIQIKCSLCTNILQKSNFIFENLTLKNEKGEILYLKSNKKNNKFIALDPILYFRQINSFSYDKNNENENKGKDKDKDEDKEKGKGKDKGKDKDKDKDEDKEKGKGKGKDKGKDKDKDKDEDKEKGKGKGKDKDKDKDEDKENSKDKDKDKDESKDKNKIKFKFIGLTEQPISKNNTISLNLYLIKKNNQDKNLSKANCTFSFVTEIKNLFQVNYNCEIELKDNSENYISFELSRYNNINIEDIPEDKALLNPVETDEAIKNGSLGNFTTNIFNSTLIKANNCHNISEFRIIGTFNGIKNKEINFTMKTFPLEKKLNCTLYTNSKGEEEIRCVVSDKISLSNLLVGQQIIRDGIKELFIIPSINLAKIKCIEGNMVNEDNEDFNTETSISHDEESPSTETNGNERSNESIEESTDNNNFDGTIPTNSPPMPPTLPSNEFITDFNTIQTENNIYL